MPPPQSQLKHQYRASPPPFHPAKKRSSDEAGNDTPEVRATKRHGFPPTKSFPNSSLTPNPRPIKKATDSPKFHTNTQRIPLSLYQEPKARQSFHISPAQQDMFEHLPPSQQLIDASAYLSQPKPKTLLAPIIGTKRAWSDAARDGAWGSYECVAPMRKKPRIEDVLYVNG